MLIPCVFPWRAVNRLMKRGWGQRGTLAVERWNIFSTGSRVRRGGDGLTDSLNDCRAESNFDVLGSERSETQDFL